MEHEIERFQRDGYACLPQVVDADQCDALADALQILTEKEADPYAAGARDLLRRCEAVRRVAQSLPVRECVATALGRPARCVKALWFDKRPAANWQVAWHQDLMIAVAERHEAPGFSAWSVKAGVPHVKPPVEVLAEMVAVRIHLDPCDHDAGPLRVLPGTHRDGVLDEEQIRMQIESIASVDCLASRGGVVLMRPLLLHSSQRTIAPVRRRVLHLEFSPQPLLVPLAWYDWA